MDTPYNLNQNENENQYPTNGKVDYENTNKDNQEWMQFMLISLLFLSCSRGCYEFNKYLFNKCITACKKNKLKCRRLNSADEDKLLNECSICLDQYIKNEKIIELSCTHTYHEKCIKDWMDTTNCNSNTCPICRENII